MRRFLPLVLAGLATASPALAAARTGPIFGLRAVGNPKLGYFVYPAAAGSVVRGAVAVTNTGDLAGRVRLYAADATTGSTTGAVYLTDAAPKSVGAWISLGSGGMRLAPGQREQVPFTVHVPRGARAGQYVGGIVAETVQERQSPKSTRRTNVQIRVRNLSIVAVEVVVPGPLVPRFSVGAATAGGAQGRQLVLIHLANDGNVLRKPQGLVTIRTTKGAVVQSIRLRLDSFLPHTAVDYPVQLKKALAPGTYVAAVRLRYQGARPGIRTAFGAPEFSISNGDVTKVFKPGKPTQVGPGGVVVAAKGGSGIWKWVAIALAALVLGGGGYALALFRRRRPVTVTATPVAPPPAPLPEARPANGDAHAACDGFHYWRVDWNDAELEDGALAYLHRCRRCGLEVRAANIGEASEKAGAPAG